MGWTWVGYQMTSTRPRPWPSQSNPIQQTMSRKLLQGLELGGHRLTSTKPRPRPPQFNRYRHMFSSNAHAHPHVGCM